MKSVNIIIFTTSEVLTAALIKFKIVWIIALCRLVKRIDVSHHITFET